MKPYTLSIYESVERAWVATEQECSLEELGNILTEFSQLGKKEDSILFNLAKFKSVEDGAEHARRYHYVNGERQDTYDQIPNTVRRCKQNLISIGGLVLDVDQQHSIEDIIKLLDGIHMIIYTTFRHTWAHNKFRVVIPFSRPLLAQDIAGRERSIIETFPGVDHASFSVSQSFYFHGSNNQAEAFSCVVPGQLVDPYDFEEEEIVEYVPQPYNYQPPSDDYQKRILDALLTCSGVHYDSQSGSRNGGVLTLISICRSIGLTYEQYDAVCQQICARDSQLVHRETRRSAWTGWRGDRITREKRDEFIKANGGKVPERVERHNNSIMDKAVRDLQKIIKNIT
jgi:hypothetical protein